MLSDHKVYGDSTGSDRGVFRSLWRGFLGKCPACASHRLFASFLKVQEDCPKCSEHLGDIRADDAPPYFTIAIVGHIVVPLILIAERYGMSTFTHFMIWPALTLILTLLVMQPVKGAVIGVMWANHLTGDDKDPD